MEPTKTRIKLTWFGAIVFALIAGFATFKSLEGVATTAITALGLIIAGYQGSRAWTKGQQMKQTNEILER